MKEYVLASWDGEMGKHCISVAQDQTAAPFLLCRGGLGGRTGSLTAQVRFAVLWRDMRSVRTDQAVSQSQLNFMCHSNKPVPLVNGKWAPNFTSLGKSPCCLFYHLLHYWGVVLSLPSVGHRQRKGCSRNLTTLGERSTSRPTPHKSKIFMTKWDLVAGKEPQTGL